MPESQANNQRLCKTPTTEHQLEPRAAAPARRGSGGDIWSLTDTACVDCCSLRIKACVLYVSAEASWSAKASAERNAHAAWSAKASAGRSVEILSLRSYVEDGGGRLRQLLSRLRVQGIGSLGLPKVHPAEISKEVLTALGFRVDATHRLYATRARSG
jgi:hypothetical protein